MRIEARRDVVGMLWTEAAAVALALAVYYGSSADGFATLLALILAATFSVVVVRMLLGANRKAYGDKVSRDEYLKWLYSALGRNEAGTPYEKSLEITEKQIAYEPLRKSLGAKLRRRAMNVNAASGIGGRDWASEELRKESNRRETAKANVEELAQRYATFNMFISTVLPSFMTFAFIGNSILSRSSFSLVSFAAALLLGIPTLYALGNRLMWRRLFA